MFARKPFGEFCPWWWFLPEPLQSRQSSRPTGGREAKIGFGMLSEHGGELGREQP